MVEVVESRRNAKEKNRIEQEKKELFDANLQKFDQTWSSSQKCDTIKANESNSSSKNSGKKEVSKSAIKGEHDAEKKEKTQVCVEIKDKKEKDNLPKNQVKEKSEKSQNEPSTSKIKSETKNKDKSSSKADEKDTKTSKSSKK